jgi:hypothetical protein
MSGVAHVGAQVVAVQEQQPLACQEAQPQVGRHRWVGGVLRGSLGDVQVRLLEHVGRVEPALQAAVQAQPHHEP